MSYLVDSDWLIDAAIGRLSAIQLLGRLRAHGVAVSAISVAELAEGAFSDPDPPQALQPMQELLSTFAIVSVESSTAFQFAELRAFLRRRGMLIPDMDLLIAATALEHDLTLVTRNHRHFARVPGLRVA
ncbi:MAG: type II toxin-antitoxin system VapC family toxin [Thermomicrobiales bacterium]